MLNNVAIKITGVYQAKRRPYQTTTKDRRIHALSIRLKCGATRLSFRNKQHFIKTGDIIYFPAGADYKIKAPDAEELIVIHFDGYGENKSEIEIFSPINQEPFLSLFDDILVAWHKREPGYQAKCSVILYSILFEIEQQICEKCMSVSAAVSVQNTFEYLHANFKDPNLNIRTLARKAGVSETYFRKRFAEYCGCNPLEYIRNLRIEFAANLLKSRRYTISEIAEKSGFSCAKYFSNVFKKIKGVSPSKFSK